MWFIILGLVPGMILKRKARMESRHNKRKNKRKSIYRIINVILVIVIVVCAGIMIRDYIREKNAQDKFENFVKNTEVQTDNKDTETEVETEELGIDIPEKQIDWDAMHAECPDIYAWIYIPGTNVDYPILQSSEDMEEDYYLDHNLDGSKGYPGCIYTQRLNSKDFSDHNTVIYGHNMKNGTMFKTLHDYADREFFDTNKYIYIYMPDDTVKVYEIYGAYTYSNTHILLGYDCNTDEGFQEYLNTITPENYSGNYRTDIEVTGTDKVVTLSTCTGNSATRYLVQGVYVGEK